MLKHQNIIDKLTRLQKIALVTDIGALSDAKITSLGIPSIREASLTALLRESGEYPSFEEAARAWDADLWEQSAYELSVKARISANLMTTPDIQTAVNPYEGGISEDPCLSGAFGAALVRGIHSAGAACRLSRLSVEKSDVKTLDLKPNACAIHDLYATPFLVASKENPDAVVCSLDGAERYADCNAELMRSAVKGAFGEALVYSEKVPCWADFHEYLSGSVCLAGAELVLDRALGRYCQLKEYVKEGSATERDLEGAVEEGTAIDEQTLNAAVDRVIEFAFRVNGYVGKTQQGTAERTGLRAARESIVLLKNENMLPLAQKTRVAVIGDAPEGFAERMCVVGQARGYKRNADRSEELILEALRCVGEAEVILLFLRPKENAEGELALPANRRALIAALKKTGKRMIAILCGDADMSFDADFSAVLLAPEFGTHTGMALAEILQGEIDPSGRLTRTLYDNADAFLNARKEDKYKGRTVVGSLIGYRYYDTERMNVRYPFGFGLSYTKFAYSDLKLEGEAISFTLKNTGSRAGCEVVQVYVGKKKRSSLSPKKELKAFVRVELKAGESKRVRLPLPKSAFASFDECTFSNYVEGGDYTVFVGASVLDIRLKKTIAFEGVRRENTEVKPDNLRNFSDIKSDIKLESIRKPRRLKWAQWGSFGVLIAALIAVISKSLLIAERTYSTLVWDYLHLRHEVVTYHYPATVGDWLLLSAFIFIAVVAAAVLLMTKIRWKGICRKVLKQHRVHFKDASALKVLPKEVFEQRFSKEKNFVTEKADAPQYFDESMTFQAISEDLQKYIAERGLILSGDDVRILLSVFTASRLVLMRQSEKLLRLCEILAEYFGSHLYCDIAEDSPAVSPIYGKLSFFARRTNYARAREEAKREKDRIHLGTILHVKAESARDILSTIDRKSVV